MHVEEEARRVLDHAAHVRLDLTETYQRGWDSMTAVIVDAALQRRQSYVRVVRPRVERLTLETDDQTTDGFVALAASEQFERLLSFRSTQRVTQMHATADLLAAEGVQTVADLRERLRGGESRNELRTHLRTIRGVGPKTLNYFDVLVGLDAVAVDVHIRRFAKEAGVAQTGYPHLEAVLTSAATIARIRKGDLDAAIWAYMSSNAATRA